MADELVIDAFNVADEWTVLGDDTDQLADTNRRVRGPKAVSFDKVNGAANTKVAGIYKELSSDAALQLDRVPPWHRLNWYLYLADLAKVVHAYVRLGASAADYVEYRVLKASLAAGVFNRVSAPMYAFDNLNAGGCEFSDVRYIQVGVEFGVETDTLAGIVVDRLSVVPTQIDA